MSAILNFIKENSNWRESLNNLKINIKEKEHFALFKYNIDADFSNPLVHEARGIIIDIDKMEVVCWPFDKFHNYGESYADNIDWSSAKVQEKIDGSIIKLWYNKYENGWQISTNGTINAYDCCNASGDNFGEKVMALLIAEDKWELLDKDYTYIFEYVGPNNQIVVQYNEDKIYHIGTRSNITGQEIDVDLGIEKPKEYALSSLEDCLEWLKSVNGLEHEGFVCVDKYYKRVKVKAPDYLRLHYMAGNNILTLEKAIDIILAKEKEEYVTYFPNKKDILDMLEKEMEQELLLIKMEIEAFKKEELLPRKDFALRFKINPHFSFYMSVLYDNKELEIPKKYWLNHLNGYI